MPVCGMWRLCWPDFLAESVFDWCARSIPKGRFLTKSGWKRHLTSKRRRARQSYDVTTWWQISEGLYGNYVGLALKGQL
jgi:hypothetical protein